MITGTSKFNCMTCGYDLHAHRSADRCPECNTTVQESKAFDAERPVRIARRWIVAVIAIWTPVLGFLNYYFSIEIGFEGALICALLWLLTTIVTCGIFVWVIRDHKEHAMAMIVLIMAIIADVIGSALNFLLYFASIIL